MPTRGVRTFSGCRDREPVDADAAELIFDRALEPADVVVADVAGIGIELAEHAFDRRFHQFAAVDLPDVVAIDLIDRVGQRTVELVKTPSRRGAAPRHRPPAWSRWRARRRHVRRGIARRRRLGCLWLSAPAHPMRSPGRIGRAGTPIARRQTQNPAQPHAPIHCLHSEPPSITAHMFSIGTPTDSDQLR